jgi:D-alanyl-D-alanine carboxypeptidase
MNTRRCAVALAVAVPVLLAVSAAQAAAPPAPAPVAGPVTATRATGLGAALNAITAAGAPGAVGLLRRDGHTWQAAAGTAQAGTGIPMLTSDHFRIGSVTKTFTAVVVLQLEAGHRLRLDDTVARWLPGALPYGSQVTIRELLNHTSGVPDYLGTIESLYAAHPGSWLRHWSPAQLVALISSRPPLSHPGTQWHYSSTNYVLLGMIIQRATGHTPGEEIQRRIIRPLHLDGTSFPADATTLPAPAAHGYVPGPGGVPADVTGWNPTAAGAAGAMISTAADLSRFYRALLGGHLLPPPQLAQMLAPFPVRNSGYGLGLDEWHTPCGTVIGHNGAIYGYFTDAYTTADGQRQVVLASNMYSTAASQAQEAQIPGLLCGK